MTIYFLVCFLLLILFGVAYYAYRVCFYSSNTGRDTLPIVSGIQYEPYRDIIDKMLPALISRPCEYVTTKSKDGLTLSGRYYHVKDGAPVDIGLADSMDAATVTTGSSVTVA